MNNIVNICGVNINNVSFQQTIQLVDKMVQQKKNQFIVTPNVDHIIKLQEDLEFQQVYDEANLVIADGMPLIWASNILGNPLIEKVSGSDLLPEICSLASQKDYKVFFLGGRTGAAEKAKIVLEKKYPGLNVSGFYSPPFDFEHDSVENEKIVSMINSSNADILFVGLGAPKQEKWIFKHLSKLNVPLSIGIGVSFEFIAGIVRRAPDWMQHSGLEWLWRMFQEPKRLFRRYMIDDMKIFKLVYKQKRALKYSHRQ